MAITKKAMGKSTFNLLLLKELKKAQKGDIIFADESQGEIKKLTK